MPYITLLRTRIKMLPWDKPVSNFISSSFFTIPVFFNETLAWEQQKRQNNPLRKSETSLE